MFRPSLARAWLFDVVADVGSMLGTGSSAAASHPVHVPMPQPGWRSQTGCKNLRSLGMHWYVVLQVKSWVSRPIIPAWYPLILALSCFSLVCLVNISGMPTMHEGDQHQAHIQGVATVEHDVMNLYCAAGCFDRWRMRLTTSGLAAQLKVGPWMSVAYAERCV